MKRWLMGWLTSPRRRLRVLTQPVLLFKEGVIAVMQAERDYFRVLGEVLSHKSATSRLDDAAWALRAVLASPRGLYPEWVFDFGFNYGLRAGFRFFLIQIDRLNDLIFSSHALFLHKIENDDWEGIAETLIRVATGHEALLSVMIEFFETEHWQDANMDVVSDASALRAIVVESGVPPRRVAVWVREWLDMRECLLQLLMALPGATRSTNEC